MAAGAASVSRPSTLAAASCAFTATLVVVEATERTRVDGVTVTGEEVSVDAGEDSPLDRLTVSRVRGAEAGELEPAEVVPKLVVTDGVPEGAWGVVVDVATFVALNSFVGVVFTVVAGAPDATRCDREGLVGAATRCRGRELSVKTRTSNNRGLDHISSCEPRGMNRRSAMVIED